MSGRPWHIPTSLPAPDEVPLRVWAWLSFSEKGVRGSTDSLAWGWMDWTQSSSLPQNALPSDEDDKDPNDPYRALDIDLDK